MPISLSELTGKETLAELRAMIDSGETFFGHVVLPGGDPMVDQIRGTQFPMFVTLALDPVLNDRGDQELRQALPDTTLLEDAVPAVRLGYRLSARQQLFGVITEWRQRRARRLVDPDAPLSPRTQRAVETWLGVLTRGVILGGLNTHIDQAVRQCPQAVKDAIVARIWAVQTQGDWQLMRVKLAGQFGAWKYAPRYDRTTGAELSPEERQAQAGTSGTPMPEGDGPTPGDGIDLDEEPF